MARLACVKLPLFALQVMLKMQPEWRNFPAVLLDRVHPQGLVMQANRAARRARILPGARYASALSLCPQLRAATLEYLVYQQAYEALGELFQDWSPHFDSPYDFPDLFFLNGISKNKTSEKSSSQNELSRSISRRKGKKATRAYQVQLFEEAAIFWLQISGMDKLYGTFEAWAQGLEAALKAAEFHAAIAVGYSRFGTYALAHARGVGVQFSRTPQEEECRMRAQPLARLSMDVEVVEALSQLGVQNIGAFLALPSGGIATRFGPEIRILYDFARDKYRIPIKKTAENAPIEKVLYFEPSAFNAERVLFGVKSALHEMVVALAGRGLVLGRLTLNFVWEDGQELVDEVHPARPSLDEGMWMELIRLRLEKLEFKQPPGQLSLLAAGYLSEAEQARLLNAAHDRRWEEAQHALARIRAEFGPETVLQIEARDAHLPEARFSLRPLQKLARPRLKEPEQPRLRKTSLPSTMKDDPEIGTNRHEEQNEGEEDKKQPTMVRRILSDPAPLGPVMPREFERSIVEQRPYLICGGWWEPEEVEREYYYVETGGGELLWVFFDRVRGGWFVHGRVE